MKTMKKPKSRVKWKEVAQTAAHNRDAKLKRLQRSERTKKRRSLHGIVQHQLWGCDRCHCEGATEYRTDEGCYAVAMRIRADHAAKSPKCQDGQKIRVMLNDRTQRRESDERSLE